MKVIKDFEDYEILDMASGQKLERWNGVLLSRPDPQIIWPVKSKKSLWDSVDAKYTRSKTGGGEWHVYNKDMEDSWTISWKDLTFNLKLMGFKHTGLFPEQSYNWNIIRNKIANSTKRSVKVLNLFAYTGGATIAASYAGAIEVVHVDASQGMNDWAKENAHLSNVQNNKIRYICDDVLKFVRREKRRGNKYDAIIMDPPTYGRGPSKELWRFEDSLNLLINECIDILSDKPLFLLINSYTKGITPEILKNIITTSVENRLSNGKITTDEIGLKIKESNLILPCGIYGRWEANEEK